MINNDLLSTTDYTLKGRNLKDYILSNFTALNIDHAGFEAGKSGKIPYGQIKNTLGKILTNNIGFI